MIRVSKKELGPWNKADEIGRQWRCCSLSWRLLSPRVSEECGESLTGSAPCEKPGASQRWPDFSWQLHFMVSKCQLQEKKNWQGRRRSVIYLHSFSQHLHVIPALFKPWGVSSKIYLSLQSSFRRETRRRLWWLCLLFRLIFIIINQASCSPPAPQTTEHSFCNIPSVKKWWKETTQYIKLQCSV